MKIPKVLFIHKCVEAIQEIPKLEIIAESKLCSKEIGRASCRERV